MKKRFLAALVALCAAMLLMSCSSDDSSETSTPVDSGYISRAVESGEVWNVTETTSLDELTLAEGGTVTVPEGYSLSLTVDGVETGSELATTDGVEIEMAPGTYQGDIVLTVAGENLVEFVPMGPPDAEIETVTFPFRQALFLDETGVVEEKSVLSAVSGLQTNSDPLENLSIGSDGECFNGIYAAGGDHAVSNTSIDFSGNGRSDFAGYGGAVMSTGESTRLVLDGVNIVTRGVVRTAALADKGSNLVVKNSHLQTYDGVMPDDYIPTIDMAQMRSVPWMLSLSGNCRATNLLGTNTRASYINSYIGAEGWGVLSTDACTTPQLTGINSTIAITGEDGYGSYGIGDAIERFLGCTFDVATYAAIGRDCSLYFGDSTPEAVAQLNTDLDLGLTAEELAGIDERQTIVNSRRFGIMWHGGGTLDISGGTVFNTVETTFLDKGQSITITVDGSQGAQLNPGNGVILQVMDDDDPGANMEDMSNTGVYTEPTGDVELQEGHDPTVTDEGDVLATFSNIALNGDFYNGMRGDVAGPFAPASPLNLGLTFVNSSVSGMITASETHHNVSTITVDEYRELGNVTNTPGPAVNNGVVVSLASGSTWTVTGTCYLTGLTIDADSAVQAPAGQSVTMTVDGVETAVAAGAYTGAIVLTVADSSETPDDGEAPPDDGEAPPDDGSSDISRVVESGEVWEVTDINVLGDLTLAEGGTITVPDGYSLSMTVDGVETGSKLVDTYGVETVIVPGTYQGNVVLNVVEENLVEFVPMGPPDAEIETVTFPFRQALFLDETGIVFEKSALSAASGMAPGSEVFENLTFASTGECFNGIYVEGGDYTVSNSTFDFSGNGRSDFAGYGTAAMCTGESTRLVLDNVNITTRGVVRTVAVADQGSNLVVKNSNLQAYNGVMPDDYIPTIDMAQMRSVPWMLGLSGNCRATNLLGTNTKASYINSYISAEGWGVLSTDACTTPQLTAINSTIAITGEDGYGSYGIGDAVERFLGCTFDVATYAAIGRDCSLYYGDSDPEAVAQLNTDLNLGLTAEELAGIEERQTVVNSRRFGIMWHGGGTLDISGGTVFNTVETTFLDKGQAITITVDGSRGAQLNPGNGVILQVMDDDDPGANMEDMTNTGVYTEPTGDVELQEGHDPTVTDDGDVLATFSNIALNGNFYNGMRGDVAGPFAPASPLNLGLTFVNSSVNGMITASETHHNVSTITADEYLELGVVTNTPEPAVNNGVIVSLASGSTWTVAGTSYLTGLAIDADSTVQAPAGQSVTMTVDGVETAVAAGTYTGAIVLTVD